MFVTKRSNPKYEPVDTYFKNTSMLLHGENIDAANYPTSDITSGLMDINTGGAGPFFIDNSSNKIPITTVGTLGQGSLTPYNPTGYSGHFDGTGDYFTVPYSAGNFSMGSGDFTIECWVMMVGVENPGRIFNAWNTGTGAAASWQILNAGGDTIFFSFSTNGVSATTITKGSLARDTWYHLAAVRNGDVFTFYVNGTSAGTSTQAITLQTPDTVTIGARRSGASYVEPFNGFISNVRVVKGTAVYTADFTPPTRKFEAITNTTLLTLQNPYVKDNSTNNLTLTRVGDITIQPMSPFTRNSSAPTIVGSSVFNNASTRYLIMRNGKYQNATQFGLRDFCVETWVYFETLGSDRLMVESWASSVGWQLYYKTSTGFFVWQIAGTIRVSSTTTPVIGQWYHVALSRNNYVLRMYVNGVLETTVTPDNTDYTQVSPLATGIQFSTLTLPMAGYLSDVRITTGNPVYGGGNFTPPTGPLQPIDGTQFLLGAKEIGIKDATNKNNITIVGIPGTKISVATKKFNTGALNFNGTTEYLSISDSPLFDFAGNNFTVEAWIYRTGGGVKTGSNVLNQSVGGATSDSAFYFGAGSDGMSLYLSTSGTSWTNFIETATATTTNRWDHVVWQRRSNTLEIYLNGVLQTISAGTSAFTGTVFNSTRRIDIGSQAGSGLFTGLMDELRVTKGIARYTSSFTVPDRAFPNR